MNNSKRYNLAIQELRGIALVSILIFHYFFRYEEIFHDAVFRGELVKVIPLFGLFIFCLISGFYIDNNSTESINYTFLSKRIIKIWIPYIISISVIYAVTSFFRLDGRQVSFKDFLLNIPLLNGYIGSPYVDSSHWYLTTLVSATVIVYVFRRTLNSDKRIVAYVIWLGVVLTFLLLRFIIGGNRYLTFIITLLGGEYIPIIISGILTQRVISSLKQRIIGILGIIVSIIFVFLYFGIAAGFIYVLCIWLFLLALLHDFSFTLKPLVIMGNISFYVYLLHQNIGYVLIHCFENARQDLYYTPRLLTIGLFVIVGFAFSKLILVINRLSLFGSSKEKER